MSESEVVTLIYTELLKTLGGGAVVLASLSAFLGRIWITRIASEERHTNEERLAGLRADLQRSTAEVHARLDANLKRRILVDKVQFEHEYAIYKEAWSKLDALRQATLRLRPMLDQVNPDESEEERVRARLNDLVEPYNLYREVVEANKPFYSNDVYSALRAVLEACHSEAIGYEFKERSHREYWSEAGKNREVILRSIESGCEAIRDRITALRVA